MDATLLTLPKIELHRHLEGSWRLETLCAIAREYCLPIPSYEPEEIRPQVQIMPDEPHTAERFLSKFRFLRQFFRSETIIKRVVRETVIDAATDGIRYMELRFTPQALNNIMRVEYDTVIEWVCEESQSAARNFGIDVRLIVSMNRHEGASNAEAVLDAALAFRDRGVVGLDLAGNENGYPVDPFRMVFRRAKREGLFVTIHAGEWAGAESIRDAIELLDADRIGHGIRILEDPALVAEVARRGIPLEVCPNSNVDSGICPHLREHPLPLLMKNGLNVTVNTDDPLISSISLTDQLAQVMEHLGWALTDVRAAQVNAANAAFLSQEGRAALLQAMQG